MGWHVGMSGPVFPDLRQIIQEGLAISSWIFTIEQCGYLCGSLIGGILYDKLNKVLLLAGSSFGFGVSILLTPYCSSLAAMLFIKCAGGFFFGSLDTGCYADIISVWGEHAGPYLQALHFAFAIGTLLSPLATEPFLAVSFTTCESNNMTSDNVTDQSVHETTNAAISNVSTTATLVNKIATLDNSTIVPTCNCETLEETNVRDAFLISSFFLFSATVCYIYIYIKIRRNKRKMTISETKVKSKDDMCHKRNEMSIHLKIIVLSILSLLVSLSCAAEDSFSGFLATF
ncbi:sodium-dependent glucose transporter 1-like isoform X2 [Ruditapes philippinarum]|uniref:sodium-dependent glucose transporter 1-like isoform X2 n=1 Tax=Ruditapes philippinarum TaxID=129788 RepID=UPI00295C394E|nr:sodium-dependent glucose transporter 1-like isoform X2 [Ruditapes philippinarum]